MGGRDVWCYIYFVLGELFWRGNKLLCFSWSTIQYISLLTHDHEGSLLYCFKTKYLWFGFACWMIFVSHILPITFHNCRITAFSMTSVPGCGKWSIDIPHQPDDDTDMFNTAKVWVFFKSLILIMFIIFVNSCEASDCPSTPLGNDSQTATFSDQILVFL